MINEHRKTISITMILIAVISLSSCSAVDKVKGVFNDRGTVKYQDNKSIEDLEIPPDLTKPEFDRAFELPSGTVSANALKNGTATIVAPKRVLSTIRTVSGKTFLQVNDTYPRSLVLTEAMTSLSGFNTVSKSASGDMITAKYIGENVLTNPGKRFSILDNITIGSDKRKLRSNKALEKGDLYQITIKDEQGIPTVRVTSAEGHAMTNAAHAKIISLLNTTFNK